MKRQFFEVYNHAGTLIVKGDATQCAAALGIAESSFWNAAQRGEVYKGLRIVRLPQPDKVAGTERRRLAAKWDAFCGPLREMYGIAVKEG